MVIKKSRKTYIFISFSLNNQKQFFINFIKKFLKILKISEEIEKKMICKTKGKKLYNVF